MLQATRGIASVEPLPSQLGGPTCFEDLFAHRVLKRSGEPVLALLGHVLESAFRATRLFRVATWHGL
eukprot:14866391-Alexandrium_andersonii.AAC.1